jgi:hypothetical protein
MSNVTGHENIDILTATSSKQPIALNILLEMTVAGEIQKSEQASYNFMIMDAQEMVYMVTYQNGTCMGMSMSDSSSEEYTEPDILVATGAGTDTLRVTLPIDKLGGITEFIFSGAAMESEFGDDYFYMYVDQVPDDAFPFAGGNGDINGNGDDNGDYWYDMPVRINEPKDGATIFKECNC